MRPPAIETQRLTCTFGDKEALRGLDLLVHGPGVFGFIGVNGAGKSTTMRILNGFLPATSGRALLFGEAVGPDRIDLRRRVGYLPQVPAFYPWMTGEEVLLFSAEIFGLDGRMASARATRLLEQVGLIPDARRRVGGYSVGMRQRLGIATALISDPELLLLDEPVSTLDPVGRAEVLNLIGELGQNTTIFFSSHVLNDAERVCKEVAILHQGRLVVSGRTDTLKERFIRPYFELTSRGDVALLLAQIKSAAWLEQLEERGWQDGLFHLRLAVSDVDAAAAALPVILARAGASLFEYRVRTPTLEELFFKVLADVESP